MQKLLAGLGKTLLLLLLTLGLLEGTLRVLPQVVPGVLLEHFDKRLSGRIATGRYPTEEQRVPFERTPLRSMIDPATCSTSAPTCI